MIEIFNKVTGERRTVKETCGGVMLNQDEVLIKPPMGVMPENLFIEQRIVELADAISSYAKEGLLKGKIGLITIWCDELKRRIGDIADE